jgi:hypothetical protein
MRGELNQVDGRTDMIAADVDGVAARFPFRGRPDTVCLERQPPRPRVPTLTTPEGHRPRRQNIGQL